MGAAGINALDRNKVSFLIDANTHWAALELEDVKTKDVNTRATIENGQLTGIWGYENMVSAFMHEAQASRLANSAGKIDLTLPATTHMAQSWQYVGISGVSVGSDA